MDLAGLFSDLVRLEIELWNAVDARLRDAHDMPLARFEPMQVIARIPQCRVQDIAASLSITVGGTSKIVDRLETSGLCLRRPDPSDGRSSLIELTPDGQQLLAAARETYQRELERRLGAAVPPETLAQFNATVQLLRLRLREHGEVSPP